MINFSKKVLSFVLVIAIISSIGMVAMATAEMENMVLAGYDTTDPYNPNKILNEVIDGKYTNKQVLVPVEPEWKTEGYESVYPYAGYDRMYLEGKAQDITAYNNSFPQWEERRKDYTWQLKEPYYIYERQQTKVNNATWTWDFGNESFGIPDEALVTKTKRTANVLKVEYKNYGFGKYNNAGEKLTWAEKYMYDCFTIGGVIGQWENLVKNTLTVENLSARDAATNQYIYSDEDIAALIPVVKSKYVTAKFYETSDEGLATKSVADEFLVHFHDWKWDVPGSFKVKYDAEISWTAPAYEMAEPYNMYQYLIVNGVVLDGTDDKDLVLRYTGGKATPKVEWKFEFFQNAMDENGNFIPGVYEVVERKYVDGVAAVDKNNNPIYRVPTGEYGNTYFKLNGKVIEYWVVDAAGNTTLLSEVENWTGSLGGLIDAYANGSFYYGGYVYPEYEKVLP